MKTVRRRAAVIIFLSAYVTNSAHAIDINTSCPPATSDAFYYPLGTFDTQYNDMDEDFRRGFALPLAYMNEPSLSCGSIKEQETYRLLFLAAFGHPVAIRIAGTTSGFLLESTELSGGGGDPPGMRVERKRSELREGDWKELKTAIDASMFWSATTSSEVLIGIDGDSWIIEGRKGQEYHAVGRFHPKGTALGNLGQLFFKLSGITPEGLD
jgi:hypothetical protein